MLLAVKQFSYSIVVVNKYFALYKNYFSYCYYLIIATLKYQTIKNMHNFKTNGAPGTQIVCTNNSLVLQLRHLHYNSSNKKQIKSNSLIKILHSFSLVWSKICQTNKEVGGHTVKFVMQEMASGPLWFSSLKCYA